MQIDVIDDLNAFTALRGEWEAIYIADPEAQYFLSWEWLSQWLPTLGERWFILAAKEGPAAPRHVAFFPLRLRTKMTKDGRFYNEINMAGNYAADYTGFISLPEFQRSATTAFAKHLKRMHWTRLRLDNFRAAEQVHRLLRTQFSPADFHANDIAATNKIDNVNNLICPLIELPGSWDRYLETLSSNTRQKLRRYLRMIDAARDLRITHANHETVGRDIDMMLDLWKAKWGHRKGRRLDVIIDTNRKILTRCFEFGSLSMPILWSGDRPVGALAIFDDRQKKSMLFYMAARDDTFSSPPPGVTLHAYAIRRAIEMGYVQYDFMRGDEPYKFMLGATQRQIACTIFSTCNGRNLGGVLDPRSLPAVIDRATKLHQDGKSVEAVRAYKQALDAEPRNATALYRYGQLLATRNDFATARRVFATLTDVQPESWKAWLWLARSWFKLKKLRRSADAYREALALKPGEAIVQREFSLVLSKLGEDARAVAPERAAAGDTRPSAAETAGAPA